LTFKKKGVLGFSDPLNLSLISDLQGLHYMLYVYIGGGLVAVAFLMILLVTWLNRYVILLY